LDSERQDPSSPSQPALRRQISEVGAVCSNSARTDLVRLVQPAICGHRARTFRATGITAYLQNGGTLEHAQQIAAHQSPRTIKPYDRTKDEISLHEVERIKF
jgi:hypothetical protein